MPLTLHLLPLAATVALLVSRRVSMLTAGTAGMALAAGVLMAALMVAQPSGGAAPDRLAQLPSLLPAVALKAGEGAWLAWHAMSIIAAGLLFHRAFEARTVKAEAQVEAKTPAERRRAVFVACLLAGPFAESVTGFGVGLVVALALLRPLNLPPAHAAALGLFSQMLAPWGALGVGTRVGAELIGVSFTELGTASAALMVVVLPSLLLVFWRLIHGAGLISSPIDRARDLALMLALAGLLWLTNRFVAPELGGGLATAVLLLAVEARRLPRDAAGLSRLLALLWPYVVLVGGLMATRLVPPMSGWTADFLVLDPFGGLAPMPLLRHPSTWLVAIALVMLAGLPRGRALHVAVPALRAALVPMAATLVFVELAAFMAASGGATAFGQAWQAVAGSAAVLAVPVLGAATGMLTGSNTASNALMMHIQVNLASGSGLPLIAAAAIQVVAGSVCTLLTPGRIVLASSLLGLTKAESAIYRLALPIGVASTASLLLVVTAWVWLV
ncbi:L-lactate permease [Azospirillum brasilense]|uniref:L-lactate permease n=1 Tax=Azospirillum brasilense TaxID=192 RepID=A0A0P0FER1_AZOBR|nr:MULTISPECIES: L-lactate permease [Azospirillum]ALJ38740.1 lactate permease [Azospirillum brasilense]MDW7553193.1 L-lactate permease [Azospirillum brasilense]MDW7593428.1 L-lactate permease [Azospirillum brasilense]MDW7628512.1 L-lactate permease [Azospirillum brasilense]MDX5955393.1 L-lactate permease [Azospirillum brasilense]